MTQILIYGVSRQGGVVLGILHAQKLSVHGFLDDNPQRWTGSYKGFPVFDGLNWIQSHPEADLSAIVAIGNNQARVEIGTRLRDLGIKMINAVHPSAVLMKDVHLGTGILIGPGAVLVSGTFVQNDAVINTGASIDHDSTVERGVYVSPGVCTAGCVTIREKAFVGIGAVIGPGVTIGEGSIVGAGSLVLEDVPPRMLVYGRPSKSVRSVPERVDWSRILGGKKSS